jgi:hypothetical protein
MNMKGNGHSFKVYPHYLKAAKLKQFDSDLFLLIFLIYKIIELFIKMTVNKYYMISPE